MDNIKHTGLVFVSALLALKLFLIPCYTSTDFEVHRNWLAVTFNKPICEWYYEKTSEWTLDYPPFFGYFEYILANVGHFLGVQDLLVISSSPVFNTSILVFQRLSVIATDLLYFLQCFLLSVSLVKLSESLPRRICNKARTAVFVLLSGNVGLILVDNIHFQYNSMLTSFLLLSLLLAENGSFFLSAVCYCVLINFKHIYIYYAPAFGLFFLRYYFEFNQTVNNRVLHFIKKGVQLGLCMATPFICSLGPFYSCGRLDGLGQIVKRLFPVSRGLTHAYWAPNFWALYNFVDFVLFKVLSLLKFNKLKTPSYITGLVKEHTNAVLPSINPFISLVFVMSGLMLLFPICLQKKRPCFFLMATFSGFAFFFFGYHVHEKAILMITIPLTVSAIYNPKYLSVWILLSTVSSFTLFPLLLGSFEVPIKYGLAVSYLLGSLWVIRNVFELPLKHLLPVQSILLISLLTLAEIYHTFLHKLIFKTSLEFLPLMIISVINAISVTVCLFWLIKLSIEDEYLLFYKMRRCEVTEALIKEEVYPVQSIESIEEVQLIGGVDISTSKVNPQIGVVTFVVMKYPELKVLDTCDKVVFLNEPYINDYLALREAEPIAEVVRNFVEEHPSLRPDVLFCDGNGQFHSRGCGVASHIGALTGIATIGVAKNLNLSLLKKFDNFKDLARRAENLVDKVSAEKHDGFTAFDIVLPVVMNVVRAGKSTVPVYVSAGYGIDLSLSTQLVINCSRSRVSEPIRMADLRSREIVRDLFD